ncbi:MAG TPA: fatty acid desaturase family protein [Nevskiaceae bacterium]|nr:fatty acid desaturase family protein [Nevskiaceae bacterium]
MSAPAPESSTPTELPGATRLKLRDLFSREEIAELTARSDARGAWAVAFVWITIALTFAALAAWPSVLTFVVAVFVLGSRQLALAILGHEAAHRTLFRTSALNDGLTDWLCARPVWQDIPRYREHHFRHHMHTGTDRDPDTSLVTPFPTTRRSLAKKVLRDLTGQTGLRRLAAQVLMDIGVFGYTVAAKVDVRPRDGRRWLDYAREGIANTWRVAVANLVLFGVLWACGIGWTYVAWVVAWLTTFSLFIRIRSIAEHACLERVPDMFRNTRTTRAGWLARATVAPFNVNYHLEHHVMASVPYFRLPRLHALLRERQVIAPAPGYVEVLRTAGGKT